MHAIGQRSMKHSPTAGPQQDVAPATAPWLALSAPASLLVVVGLIIYLAKISF